MSTPTKLRGGSDSELTKLKALWRGLSEDARGYWLELFVSKESQEAIRGKLLAKLKVNLRWDRQLNDFRGWVKDQAKRDQVAARMEENSLRLQAEHPEWTADQVREEVIKQAYYETLASGDFKLGLATADRDLNERTAKTKAELEKAKLKLREQAEQRQGRKLSLEIEKFQFDAVAQCRKHLPSLKAVEANKGLSESQKTQIWMETLFGVRPAPGNGEAKPE